MMLPKLLQIFYTCCLILALSSVNCSFRARRTFLLACISLSNCLSSSNLISVSLRIKACIASILRAMPRADRSAMESSCSQQAQLASTSEMLVLSRPTTASRKSFLSYYWGVSSRSTLRPQSAMFNAQLLQYRACGCSSRKNREARVGWFLQWLGRGGVDCQDYIQRLNK